MSIESEIKNSASNMINSIGLEVDKKVKNFTEGNALRSLVFGEINIKKYIDIQEYLKEVEQYDLLIGIPSENTGRAKGEQGINNAELAYIHTHGVDKKEVRQEIQKQIDNGMNFNDARKKAHQMFIMSHGSPAYRIPPRPIIEPAIEANSEKINEKLLKSLKSFLNFDLEQGVNELKKTGMFAQNKVRSWFTDSRNGWPPNSPLTIKAKKGKDRPLIDTGELRKSITYVVKKKNGR